MEVCERSVDRNSCPQTNENSGDQRCDESERKQSSSVAVVLESSSDEDSKALNSNGQSQGNGESVAQCSPSSAANLGSSQQKRPMNAFLIFCKRHRSVVKQKYPYLENRSITKILGEWWAALDADQKQKYTELARQYKEAFMKANPHFKWYKTDIKLPAMQPPSPPPIAPRMSENNHNASHSSSLQQNVQTNSTPKPPKKRYLESREFKGSNNHVNHTSANTSAPQPETKRQRTPPLIGGPPILDIDTMNRVIENAFGASPSNNSFQQRSSNSVLSARSNEKTVDEGSALEENSADKCERNKYSRTCNNVPNASVLSTPNGVFRNTDANTSSHDKPLNLSSSKVLHTSNQQIIDHYIDKLLSTAPTGNPMPVEMQSSQSSMNSTSVTNTASKAPRKDRQCKGKRYLEMLNESKMTKRNKHNGVLNHDDSSQKSNTSNGGSTSKWVSGGFDLEEHIAALPQLGDKHLVNALNHSKASKSSTGAKTQNASSDYKTSRNESETDSASSADSVGNESSSLKDSCVVSDDEATLIVDLQSRQTPRDTMELNGLNFSEKCRVLDSEKRREELLRETQGIECDGLTALAEVALQQANRIVALQSSS